MSIETLHPWFGPGPRVASAVPEPGRVAEQLRHELRGLPFSTGGAVTPLVLPARSYDELFGAARRLLGLLRRAGLGVADTRAGRLAAHGVDAEDWPLFFDDEELERRYCTSIARADVVVGHDGPRFVEFNVSGVVGGVTDTHVLTHGFRRAYGGTFAGQPLGGADPLERRAALFESMCAELGRPPAVAIAAAVRTLWSVHPGPRYFDVELSFLRGRGWPAEIFEPEDLVSGLGLPGRPRFPVGLRYMTVQEWREAGIGLEPLRAALDAGCLLLSPQSSYFVADKKVFAWLSAGQPWMSEDDRRFVDRYVPWTRVVADVAATWRGHRCGLMDLLLRERDRFLLKAAFGMNGQRTVAGPDSSDAEWREAVARAVADGDMVAQELVEPVRCEIGFLDGADGESGGFETRAIAPVLSPLVFGHLDAGCHVRYLPTGHATIVTSRSARNVAFRGA